MRALLSVYDKTGLTAFAPRPGPSWDGSWWRAGAPPPPWTRPGVAATPVEAVTGAPEMLDGRVKTLHPGIHGGILADRRNPRTWPTWTGGASRPSTSWCATSTRSGPDPGSRRSTSAGRPWCGPRPRTTPTSAWSSTPPTTGRCSTSSAGTAPCRTHTRRRLARAAFAHTAAYDAAIVGWLDDGGAGGPAAQLPPTLHLALERVQDLRYGENPHQEGARYRDVGSRGWWDGAVQHGGQGPVLPQPLRRRGRLAAGRTSSATGPAPAAAIIKHANPCGAAVADDIATAYQRAFECDPMSAFGGHRGAEPARRRASWRHEIVANPMADVLVAPGLRPGGLELLRGQAQEHAGARGAAAGTARPGAAPARRGVPGAGGGPLPAPAGTPGGS